MHDSTHHLRLALAIHEESLPPEGVARSPFAQVDWYTMKYSAEHAAEYSELTLPRMVFMSKDKYVKHMSWCDLQGLLSFLPHPRATPGTLFRGGGLEGDCNDAGVGPRPHQACTRLPTPG